MVIQSSTSWARCGVLCCVPTVDLVSDPPTQLSTSSRGAEPSSESAASLMLDLLMHGTVFHTISIKSVTLVFSSAASKLNYFVEHTSLVVSAPGRSVNSAIEIIIIIIIISTLLLTSCSWEVSLATAWRNASCCVHASDSVDLTKTCEFSQFDSCGFTDTSIKSSRWAIVSKNADERQSFLAVNSILYRALLHVLVCGCNIFFFSDHKLLL